MTINDVIAKVDELKQNIYTPEQKANWIIKIDGLVNSEIVKGADYVVLEYPADDETPLLVPAPYDDVYGLYVMSMIAFHQGEIDDYSNIAMLYNEAYSSYAKYYRRNNMPTQTAITNIW